MKIYFLALSLSVSLCVYAQPKLIQQATITTTTNVIAPEEEETPNYQGGSGMNFRNMMDGEMKSTTYLKDDMVKTVLKSELGRSTIFRNNATKMTTTLLEIMGSKQGFYISDSEQTELRKKADSMMQSRRKTDTIASNKPPAGEPVIEIADAGETKKIAGYNCKKTYLITTRILGLKDTVTVWYTPEIKMKNISSTGGLSAFGNMGMVKGLDKIDGFVMRYETSVNNNRKMEVEVTKIDTGKAIDDKEFAIPTDIEIKPMREMRNMFGGGGMPR